MKRKGKASAGINHPTQALSRVFLEKRAITETQERESFLNGDVFFKLAVNLLSFNPGIILK